MYFTTGLGPINPKSRSGYQRVEGYPETVFFGHSRKWPQIIADMSRDDPGLIITNSNSDLYGDQMSIRYKGREALYLYAGEGPLAIHTAVTKQACLGARNMINIGCAGALSPELELGDLVVGTEALRHSGFGRHIASEDQPASCSDSLSITLSYAAGETCRTGKIWCVDTLYYPDTAVSAAVDDGAIAVEMEMEAGALTAEWATVNNLGKGPINFGQLAYMSDVLPRRRSRDWEDPFTNTHVMIPWKKKAFNAALHALVEI